MKENAVVILAVSSFFILVLWAVYVMAWYWDVI
jgi:hypothetical protein